MLRGGPTLFYATGPTEREWVDRPAYPRMTKEYIRAAAPGSRNNSGPDQSHFQGFVSQGMSNANALHSVPDAHRLAAVHLNMPQRSIASHDPRGRPQGGLPQRPEPHILPADVAKMSQGEICRNFQAGRCLWGHKCHRSHVLGGGLYAPNVAPAHPGPAHMRAGQPGPSMQPSCITGSVGPHNRDRQEQVHSERPGVLARSPRASIHNAQPSLPTVGSEQRQAPPTQSLQPAVQPPADIKSQVPVAEPEILDAQRLNRATEVDPRPSRRTDEVCMAFQKGRCLYGDRCSKTHIFLVPQSCITQLLPPPQKPAVRKIPATVMYTAPDGTVHEREVCKMAAAGRCPRGESCRYAHITEDQLDSDDSSSEGDSSESCSTGAVKTVGKPASSECAGEALDHKDTVGCSGSGVRQKKNKQVCRLYFKKRYCYKVPCMFSHDIMELARQLPPDDELVLQHAEEIRVALSRSADEFACDTPASSSPSSPPPAADTAKKRRKKPRKPGAKVDGSLTDSAAKSQPILKRAKGRERAQGKVAAEPAAPEEQDAYEGGDGNSTDATFYSAETHGAPEPSASDTQCVPQAHAPRLPCYDYIHGRCVWPNCRYSHDIDREKMRCDFRQRTGASSSTVEPSDSHSHTVASKTAHHSAQPSAPPHTSQYYSHVNARGSGGTAAKAMQARLPASGGARSEAPVVPPGLGLEQLRVVLSAPRASQPRIPPDLITVTVLDSTKVTFGSGFAISHITTGFECRKVILEDVPVSVVPATLSAELGRFGDVTAVVPLDAAREDERMTYLVTFATGDAAAQAAQSLEGKELFGSKISARLDQKKSTALGRGTLYDGDVLFELPTPSQVGFVGYPTEDLARRAIDLARTVDFGFSRVVAEPYQGIPNVGTFNVRFRGLPPHFTPDDVKKHFVDRLGHDEKTSSSGKKRYRRKGKGKEKDRAQPEDDRDKQEAEQAAENCEGVMLQRAKYNSLRGAILGLQRMLEEHDEDVSLNVLPPPYGKVVRVWAHFKNPDAAASACDALHRFCPRFVGKQRIFAHHIKSLRYNLPPNIFDVLACDIDLLRSYIHDDDGTSISVLDRRAVLGPAVAVIIKLVSQSMQSLAKAKAAFERLLRGEKVTENGQLVWNDFFGGKAGQDFLRNLEVMHPKVKISSDPLRRNLTLFGIREERELVREAIMDRVRHLKSQLIHRYSVAGHLIGVFMSEDLVKLQQELGHENVWFDLTHQQLVVRGGDDAQKVAQLAVHHVQQRLPRRMSHNEVVCPVCFGEVSHPVTLSCGHTWCKACLTGYLNASVDTKTFPLTCLADEARCSHPISLSTAQRLLSTEEFDAIVHAAFTAYVQQRPKEFHYCPTPDCPQVYRKLARVLKGVPALQCPSCLVRICPHCDMEYHETVSCQDRNPEDELLFEHWKMGHDVKDCPSCKVPIERTAGCNHMMCTSCKIHICWACLATFEKSGEVYEHMRSIHGGIGL
ncbi:hypothetical protein OH77DRAFT_1418483 [Trametes cingulata]|nr:hypothetical protein OH77DRAFT_1418483 [Trametes cingulata]